MRIKNLLFILMFLLVADVSSAKDLPVNQIKLPDGFKIEVYATNIPFARQMALSPNGNLYVGTRKGNGKVYRILQTKHGPISEVVAEELNSPNGVAFRGSDLYVGEIHRIIKFVNIDAQVFPYKYEVVNDLLPKDQWHGWKYIRFGPDDKLYVPIGAPCNVCEKADIRYATIMRMNPDGTGLDVFARGIRNSVGFDWDPMTNKLWFTDNGRYMLGDDLPPDELNFAPTEGMHFGFPYCHGKSILDPEFGDGHSCEEYSIAKQELGPHVASLGMSFYRGEVFPDEYRNQIFIAEHGSWNRSTKIGYRISLVRISNGQPVSYETFAEGWLQGDEPWGRPVDVLNMPDGSLLISDDYAGAIYRIYYSQK